MVIASMKEIVERLEGLVEEVCEFEETITGELLGEADEDAVACLSKFVSGYQNFTSGMQVRFTASYVGSLGRAAAEVLRRLDQTPASTEEDDRPVGYILEERLDLLRAGKGGLYGIEATSRPENTPNVLSQRRVPLYDRPRSQARADKEFKRLKERVDREMTRITWVKAKLDEALKFSASIGAVPELKVPELRPYLVESGVLVHKSTLSVLGTGWVSRPELSIGRNCRAYSIPPHHDHGWRSTGINQVELLCVPKTPAWLIANWLRLVGVKEGEYSLTTRRDQDFTREQLDVCMREKEEGA